MQRRLAALGAMGIRSGIQGKALGASLIALAVAFGTVAAPAEAKTVAEDKRKPVASSPQAQKKAAAKPAHQAKSAQPAKKTADQSKAKGPKGPTAPAVWKVETAMGRGDTLVEVLHRHGLDRKQALNAARAVADIYDPRRLDNGDKLILTLERRPSGPFLRSLNLDPKGGQELTIQVAKNATPSPKERKEVASVVVRRAEGTIAKNFREALRAAKVPDAVVADTIAAFAHDPDVPRIPPKKSSFVVVYEAEARRRGGYQNHTLRFAALNVRGKVHPVYRYETSQGDVAFLDKDGRGVTHMELGSPIRNAKITSGFGWRIHPVYGERRFHKGVDFAAPEGTPVYAADDGVIEEIGWRGGYGEYIRIRHKAEISTHYAHLSEFADGLREGSRVRRGQVIGRVGETGVATGPHLDYGVLVRDEHVNPLNTRRVVPVRLAGNDLKGFRNFVRQAGI